MVHAQEPTCIDLRIRSTQDTHKIFYAIQKGLLKMVTRRLDADERLALRSGCVYAWEERGPHSEITGLGIERFTEGRRWTPSRVRDEFLFYYERYMPPPDVNQSGSPADTKPPRDWEPLVKQTYSVWVETDNGRRKWHLTAYFTQGTIDQLRSVDEISGVRDLVVPEGHFKSTRVGKNRSKQDDSKGEASKQSSSSRQYAPFPSPYSTSSPAVEQQSVVMYDPYQGATSHTGYYHPQSQEQEHAQPHSRPHSNSPQNRSSGSLSPPVETSSRMQYSAQPTPFNPTTTHGDAKSSRMNGPVVSGQSAHSHLAEYRALPPLSAQAPMAPMHDGHGQRGKPVTTSSYTESSGLNNGAVNSFGSSDNFATSSWDNSSTSTSYSYQPSGSTGLQASHSTSVPMHGASETGPSLASGYMYNVQQRQHNAYSPTTLPHNLASIGHQYDYSHDDLSISAHSSNSLSDTPRTLLPPLHIATEEPPPYIMPPDSMYPPQTLVGPLPSVSPSPLGAPHRPSATSRALAPLYTLNRPHPYKRDHQDDKQLRLLQNGSSASPPL